jgi:uncharacterized protein (DUF2236 family)
MTAAEPIPHVEPAPPPPVAPTQRRRWLRRRASIDDGLMGVGLLAGAANVIMELARPGVGYGVAESRVESGRIDKHPIKRARTTFTYLAVATQGTDEQKAAFRRAVNRAHAQVYSAQDSRSPVAYNAFDPDLQLWVAACLYKGVEDIYRLFIGGVDDVALEQIYRDSATLGTTLQVPPEMWPEDRAAFEEYWQSSLELVHIDDTIHAFLYPIAANRSAVPLPGFIRRPLERFSLLMTAGFLPQKFRDEMRFPWDPARERRFNRIIAVIRFFNNLAPKVVRQFPFNLMLVDLDWRMRTGRPLV